MNFAEIYKRVIFVLPAWSVGPSQHKTAEAVFEFILSNSLSTYSQIAKDPEERKLTIFQVKADDNYFLSRLN